MLGWFGIDPVPWLRSSSHRAVGGDPDRHLAGHALLHGDLPRRPAGDPGGLLRRRRDRRRRRLGRFSGTSPCRCSKPTTLLVHGDERDRGDEGVRRAADHDRRRPGRFDARAAAVHLPDRLRVLRHGPRRGDERVPVRRRHGCSRSSRSAFSRAGRSCDETVRRGATRRRRHAAILERGRRSWRSRLLVVVACVTLLPYLLDGVLVAARRWRTCSACRSSGFPIRSTGMSYVLAWQAQDFTRYFLNSGVVAVAITLGNLLLGSLAGYSLTKFRYRGRGLTVHPDPQHHDAAARSHHGAAVPDHQAARLGEQLSRA